MSGMTQAILFGFHAVGVRLKIAPRTLLELHVDTSRRDPRMHHFLARAEAAGMSLVDSDDQRLQKLSGSHRLSVSLQSVTFDLSISTVDPFNLSLGLGCRARGCHASASSVSSSTGIRTIPAEAAWSSKSKLMHSVFWRMANSAA